jgi:hypothetical protein
LHNQPPLSTFGETAATAIRDTVEYDRIAVYHQATGKKKEPYKSLLLLLTLLPGLYCGETSFLDWRNQNYPTWSPSNLWFIQQSKSVSTNVGHYFILTSAATLARTQQDKVDIVAVNAINSLTLLNCRKNTVVGHSI